MATSYRTAGRASPDDHYLEAEAPKRVAWGAVFAGALLALMVMMLINLLLLGFGAAAVDPAQEQNPLSGLGMGSVIGLIVSNLIALFVGGWVAGRLANKPHSTESVLHGLLTWSVLTIVSFMLLTSVIGTMVGGVTSVVGRGLSLASQGIAAVAPDATQAVQQALGGQDLTLGDIRREASQLLNQIDDRNQVQQGQLEQQTQQATEQMQDTATDIAQNPQQAGQEIQQLINQLFSGEIQDLAESAERQDLVEALANRTDMSRSEAEQAVDNWIQTYQQAQQALQQAQQQLEQAAQQAAEALSAASFWTLIGLLIGAVVAAIGAWVGGPKAGHHRARVA
jgi:hypothetical protein